MDGQLSPAIYDQGHRLACNIEQIDNQVCYLE